MKSPLIFSCSLAVVLSGWMPLTVSAEPTADWPQWRGPDRNDHSPDKGLLKEWPKEGPKRVWLYRDAGLGYAGPSIVDGRLYTMGARDEKTLLLCLDAATGKEHWVREIDTELENDWGNGPRSTPSVDGEFVYTLGARGRLVCAKTSDGSIVWSTHLVDDHGGKVPGWGYTESV